MINTTNLSAGRGELSQTVPYTSALTTLRPSEALSR